MESAAFNTSDFQIHSIMPTLVRISLKVGSIDKTSRTSIRMPQPTFPFDPTAQGYEFVLTQVENLYIKPNIHVAQKDFVALTVSNFDGMFAIAQTNYAKRAKDSGPFMLDVYVFVARRPAPPPIIRLATAPRVQEAACTIATFLLDRSDVAAHEMAPTHWAMTLARQPVGKTPALPKAATFCQMQHLDAMRVAHDHVVHEPEFKTIKVRLNGSSDFQLSVSARELRDVLGLPPYSLVVEGIFSNFIPSPEPTEDMNDEDHQSE